MNDRHLGMRTWLSYGIYACLLWAASCLLFGPLGLLWGSLILAAWGFVFWNPPRPRTLVELALMAFVVWLIGSCLFMPSVQQAREASRRTICRNNLKQFGLALHNYHDEYGSFPPAYSVDADGRPLHSWRVLILPFVDEGLQYDQFHLNEPWNSSHNLELSRHMPAVLSCPSSRSDTDDSQLFTSYVAVVDDQTLWPGSGAARTINDVKDATSNTVLLLESQVQIPWNEPRDLSLNEALDQLTAESQDSHGHVRRDFFYEYAGDRHVLLTDGTVRLIPYGVDRDSWLQLLRIDDGIPLPTVWDDPGYASDAAKRPRYDNWIKLGVFLLVALFPLPWVWLNPRSGQQAAA